MSALRSRGTLLVACAIGSTVVAACGLDLSGEGADDDAGTISNGSDGAASGNGSGSSSGTVAEGAASSSGVTGSSGSSSGSGASSSGSASSSGGSTSSSGSSSGATSSSGGSSSGSGGTGDAATDATVAVAPPDFAWYKLDETTGSTAHDSTANHYDVHLQNVAWGNGATFGAVNGGQPSGGSVVVAAGLRQPPISFTAWVAPAARDDEGVTAYGITPFPPSVVSGDVPQQYGLGLGLDVWTDGGGGSALAVENVGYTFSNGGGAFAAGTEYFVAASLASTATLYVDGAVVAAASVTPPGPSATTTLYLGVHNGDGGYGSKRFFVGRMRDVRVYKRALTAQEVTALYADGPSP